MVAVAAEDLEASMVADLMVVASRVAETTVAALTE